ncbi:pantetheine-phosphate adenylyltransferase [Ureaplasma ceti]|uniref:Phosphopantetheine adenylyltransferase n=1 Tax=Ureaplasma ceti TaxID=3119530 RepID=A0ABP9U767_9BACT
MTKSKKNKRTAIYSGSFDPIHEGHLSILIKANALFDKVYVVVSNNPDKNSNSLEMRAQQIQQFLQDHNVQFDVIINSGLTVDIAHQLDAHYLIRGLRNELDLKYELALAQQNQKLAPDIETVFFLADADKVQISSTSIRNK